jgi:cytochrome c peroxidase
VKAAGLFLLGVLAGSSPDPRVWEQDNPLRPIPEPPLGIDIDLIALPDPPTPERVRLGRWLFYDSRLSADGTVSCGTCHMPEHGFSEPKPVSTGVRGQKGTRKAPSLLNLGRSRYRRLFWDGRASSLEEQARLPIVNPIEMGNTHQGMLATLRGISGYAKYFEEAFGSREVTVERVAHAIADYERTRMSGNSAFDRYRAGEASALSQEAKWGEALFFGRGRCTRCHNGPLFTNGNFHNEGIGWDEETARFADEGRAVETKFYGDRGAFRTPSLRDVSRRAPFMHDGSKATLREVLEHYNRGGVPNPYLDPQIEPLDLIDREIDLLVKFLESLDGEGFQDTPPNFYPQ